MDAEYVESCVKGSIVGLLIGDALGFPYSNKKTSAHTVEMIGGQEGEPPGSYQGPGALTLCTIASINEFNDISPEDILTKFNDFMIAGYLGSGSECSDLSEVTVQAIKNHLNGMPPDRCGLAEDNDGECIPRLLPVALWLANDDLSRIIDTAHAICKITHAEVVSQVACAAYCLVIRNLFTQKPEKIFSVLEDYYRKKGLELFEKELDFLRYWGDNNVADGGRDPKNSFWSAWKQFSTFESDFRSCVAAAVELGNDANTTTAIAGSFSALANGLTEMPIKWLDTLILSDEVMGTVIEFTNKMIKRVQEA